MGLKDRKPGWVATTALVLALCAAVSAPAAPMRRAAASPAGPAAPAPPLSGYCIEDGSVDPMAAPISHTVPAVPSSTPSTPDARVPRMNLLAMVQAAVRRSNAVGAARLLAEAASIDIDETKAGALPQVNLSGQSIGIDAGAPSTASTHGVQYQAGVSANGPLYDGGRIRDMADWRTHLAEAARLGEISAQEQVAVQTVSLALDRSRFTVESQVYEQYARKMGCLVVALQQIVAADRGRTSELVQARKTQQQAELSRDQALSQKRLTEIRLRRFVGDDLPPTEGLTLVLLDTPSLPDLVSIAARTTDIVALDEQAHALDAYVRAVLDGQKPQLSWLLNATRTLGAAPTRTVTGGFSISVPLFNPSLTYTTNAARKRAEAARLQREDALEARKNRMAEVHEQAEHTMDRARHVVEILHNSGLVLNYTLQQWQQLGRRSLFDVMAAEGDHYTMRVQYVDALYDTQQSNALLWSLGLGLATHLE